MRRIFIEILLNTVKYFNVLVHLQQQELNRVSKLTIPSSVHLCQHLSFYTPFLTVSLTSAFNLLFPRRERRKESLLGRSISPRVQTRRRYVEVILSSVDKMWRANCFGRHLEGESRGESLLGNQESLLQAPTCSAALHLAFFVLSVRSQRRVRWKRGTRIFKLSSLLHRGAFPWKELKEMDGIALLWFLCFQAVQEIVKVSSLEMGWLMILA